MGGRREEERGDALTRLPRAIRWLSRTGTYVGKEEKSKGGG